jgi:trigger factor
MSLIKKELTEKSGFTIEFSVSKEVYEKAEYEAYRKNVKSINVPGFRKGKAPKAIIERYYGKGIFFEDAINACIPDAFEAAVKEAGITVVGMPRFDLVTAEDDIVLKADGFVKPTVTIEGYKGIEAEKKVEPVTDEDVEAEVTRARERNARTVEVTDRAAALGDIANIDVNAETLVVQPRIQGIWKWFKVENLTYKKAHYNIYYDEDGTTYHKGIGLIVENL